MSVQKRAREISKFTRFFSQHWGCHVCWKISPVLWFPQFFQIVVLMKQVKLFGGESSCLEPGIPCNHKAPSSQLSCRDFFHHKLHHLSKSCAEIRKFCFRFQPLKMREIPGSWELVFCPPKVTPSDFEGTYRKETKTTD